MVTQSLANGSFVLKAPAPGAFLLKVRGAGLVDLEKEVLVTREGISLDLTVDSSHVLEAKVLDPRGKPVGRLNAQTWLWLDLSHAASWIIADQRRISGLGPIRVPFPDWFHPYFNRLRAIRLEVRVEGAGVWAANFDRWPDKTITVGLKPGITVGGAITDAGGEPIAHTAVTAARMLRPGWPMIAEPAATTSTDARGHYQLSDLFSDSFEFRAALRKGDPRCEERDFTGADNDSGAASVLREVDIGARSRQYVNDDEMGHVSPLAPTAVMLEPSGFMTHITAFGSSPVRWKEGWMRARVRR